MASERRYFRLRSGDYVKASGVLWAEDGETSREPTGLSSTSAGSDTVAWTSEVEHQDRLRAVLERLDITFRESSARPDESLLDPMFGDDLFS